MPQWFLPYTAAALVAAALGWLALNYDPDAKDGTAKPVLAGAAAPAANQPGSPPAAQPAHANQAQAPGATPAPQPADEGNAVRNVVTRSMTSDAEADCTRFHTQTLLEQITGEVGPEAVAKCRAESDGVPPAAAVTFQSVEQQGPGYRVRFSIKGGEMGRTAFSLNVARSGGTWKLDRLLDIELDLRSQIPPARDLFAREGFTPADADCFVETMLAIGEQPYERAYVEGGIDDLNDRVGRRAIDCLSAVTLRRQFTKAFQEIPDVPAAVLECMMGHVDAMSDAELRELIKAGNGAGYRFGAQTAEACMQTAGYVS